ncbi:MAG: hypothetical protein ABTQ30_04935, partial [Rhizobiaceae bacterium]
MTGSPRTPNIVRGGRVEEEEFVLRHSRLTCGLAQTVLALFALLVCLAPALAAAPSGGAEEHLCAPAAPRADMTGVSLGIAGDAEE